MHHRRLQRQDPIEWREQPGEPLREHRLARPWRTDEQHVVPARRRDLERQAGHRLSANVGEVGDGRLLDHLGRRVDVGP